MRCLHGLTCLKTWSLEGGTVHGGKEALRDVAFPEEVGLWRLGLGMAAWSCCLFPVSPRYEQSQLYVLTAK